MKLGIASVVASVALVLTGCTGEPGPRVTATPAVSPSAAPVAAPTWKATPTPNPACVTLSPAMMQAIAAGAKKPAEFLPTSGVAVRSSTYSRDSLWLIFMGFALEPGGRPIGGMWAATGLEPGATIYNGEATAPNFTDFPSSEADWPELRITDESWQLAFDCAGLP